MTRVEVVGHVPGCSAALGDPSNMGELREMNWVLDFCSKLLANTADPSDPLA